MSKSALAATSGEPANSTGTGAPCSTTGSPCLFFSGVDSPLIQNLEFRNLSMALLFWYAGANGSVQNCTFRSCGQAIGADHATGTWQALATCDVGTLFGGTGGGSFTGPSPVSVCDDAGNSKNAAVSIGLNSSVSKAIDYGGDADWFSVSVPSSGTLTVYTIGVTDTYGYLVDSNCNILASNDDNPYPNFSLSSSVSSGAYYICVRHFNGSSTGNYTLNTSWSSTAPSSTLVSAVTSLGAVRNDFEGWVGFQFTVGNATLTVTSLGRWVRSGNSKNRKLFPYLRRP